LDPRPLHIVSNDFDDSATDMSEAAMDKQPAVALDTPVGHIAANHPLATRVFARVGIDFCCGGGKPLQDACTEAGADPAQTLAEIQRELQQDLTDETHWQDAPLDDLIEHILDTYHSALREELPRLENMLGKVYRVHAEKDLERLTELVEVFDALKAELLSHMLKEEQILFPMIQQGDGGQAGGPIAVMEHEHEIAGAALRRIRALTDNYTPPEGACNTWRALWAGLGELESDTHLHIHLENNILFPRAAAS
jgi:regulator of cell morphogenesis and NO signaling